MKKTAGKKKNPNKTKSVSNKIILLTLRAEVVRHQENKIPKKVKPHQREVGHTNSLTLETELEKDGCYTIR